MKIHGSIMDSGIGRLRPYEWLVPVAVLLFLAALLSWEARQDYRTALEQEYRLLESHARIADAQVHGILRSADQLLQELARERGQLTQDRMDSFRAGLSRQLVALPELRSLFFADAQGRIEISTDARVLGFDIAQREYFRRAREAAEPHMIVSRPFIGATGILIVIACRPIHDAQGRFRGLVGASLDPKYFEEILNTLQAGPVGSNLILNTAGDILYAAPDQQRFAGQTLVGGPAYTEHMAQDARMTRHRTIAKITAIEKLSVFRRVGNAGLIVVTSQNADVVLAPWQRALAARIAVFFAALLAILYLARLAWRQRVEQAAAKARLRTLIDESPLPMLVAEGEGQRVAFFNRRFTQLIGYSLDEVPDVAHWWPLAYPDPLYRQQIIDAWALRAEEARLNQSAVLPVEAVIRCRNGDDRIFDVYLTRIDSLFLVVFADFTEQRRAETALRDSEAQLNKAQELAQLGSWHLDIAANKLLWSNETCRMFNVAPGTPLTYELFISRVHVDDRDLVNQAWQAAMGGAPYDIEHRIVVDGICLWVRERAEIDFNAAGQPISGTGTVQDITDRKQAELQLHLAATVFENSREGVTITDLNRKIVSVNPAFCKITGYAPEEVIGQNPRMLQSGRQDNAFYRAMWESINSRGYWTGEIWNRRKNGEAFPELLSIAVVKDRLDKPLHYIGVFTDISERKHAEEEIRQLNADLERRVRERTAELENSNRELESFSYSVSHDLRTPLRAIDGFSHVIAEEFDDALGESGRGYLQRIRAASQRMGELIDNLLDLARVSRQELTRERIDLSRLVAEMSRELTAGNPGRSVEWQIQPDIFAQGDAMLLKVALDNLLRNAWKFTAGVPAARIEFGNTASDGIATYFVRDNGAGIDMTYADKLFKPFQRLHDPKEFEGTGIGLAIVDRVIRRHGGRIRVESAPGQGATFLFTLG